MDAKGRPSEERRPEKGRVLAHALQQLGVPGAVIDPPLAVGPVAGQIAGGAAAGLTAGHAVADEQDRVRCAAQVLPDAQGLTESHIARGIVEEASDKFIQGSEPLHAVPGQVHGRHVVPLVDLAHVTQGQAPQTHGVVGVPGALDSGSPVLLQGIHALLQVCGKLISRHLNLLAH